MMTNDRRTKAQILEELERRTQQLDQAEARIVPKPRPVAEADAIAACVRALDALSGINSSSRYNTFGSHLPGEVASVVNYLALKYAVTLPGRKIDCQLVHLETASEGQLIAALKQLPVRGF